ncbi:MAG: hypothetical protein ACLR9K_11180, partial [Blautia sp.]
MSKTRKTGAKPGLQINVRREDFRKGRLQRGGNLLVPVLALYLGTVWSLLSIFELPLYVWWSSLTGVVLLLLLQAGGKLRKVGYGIAGLSLAAMLLFLLSKQTPVYQGLLLVWNDAASALG